MARPALLQDGNGSWLNAEGGRRVFAGVEIQRSDVVRASYPGEEVPNRGGSSRRPPGESTDFPRTVCCGS